MFDYSVNQKGHWEHTYAVKPADALGWYEPHLRTSLSWIRALTLPADSPIIDVGGGASTLVDDLLAEGHRAITVLDLSGSALSLARTRLGGAAESVTWIEGDVTVVDLPHHAYEVWHDRALFHFLVEPEQTSRYVEQVLTALRHGGHLIIGAFAPEAPPSCSGLPVQRYSTERMKSTLGDEFALVRDVKELHVTPSGVEQWYLYCHLRRKG